MQKIFICLAVLYGVGVEWSAAYGQAEKYPFYLKYYWGDRDRDFAVKVTDRLIAVTDKGEVYIGEYNEMARRYEEANNGFEREINNLDSPEYDKRRYEQLQGEVENLEKRYNTVKVGYSLTEANYNMCRSNCQGIYNQLVNIRNNLSNIANSYNQKAAELQRLYNSLTGKIERYNRSVSDLEYRYDIDGLRQDLNRMGDKIAAYIREQKI
ncbi:hypothetical protein [Sinomicrobium soli]|uniref:hypothetical protein n=1 Tax=Sinomicrobium sp. N-1-3-6 TaxID=2219864 RepID=UPI000DCD612E|nr:hypothetical protein [Sinomicrobium sp. N-1-3-6]RAV27480.1 hypothetical protein DN748_18360 [Sinomicrobium sp. N-1-3-6]